ncbi:MAG: TRAP transporter substrate-binding protein DctP [Deltaproteobacteria bacterium]|nr:TRAP transporter substrate-binding protein DctP [Deltaproteobacteria bacterium]
MFYNIKKSLFVCVMGLCAMVLIVFPRITEAQIKLRVAGTFPPPTVSMQSAVAKMWLDEVSKKTDGKVTFQTFWGGALGKPQEHITLAEKGMADIVLTNAHFTPGKFPLGQFEYVFPFGPPDPVVVTKAKRQMYKEFPEFAKDWAKCNTIQILNASACLYQILSREPVQKLDDFKGKKIALIGRYFGRWVQPAGAVPVVAPAADRYTMLQTKVIDMDLLPLDMFAAFKIHEQAPNLILVDALMGNFVDLIINVNSYNKLPAEIQKIMLDTGKEIELKVAQTEVKKWTEKTINEFKSKGVKIFEFPSADRDKWASLVEDIPAEWAVEVTGQGYPGWKIVDRYQELCAQMGYKWARKWGVKK